MRLMINISKFHILNALYAYASPLKCYKIIHRA
jgi:hypothetical protein